MSPTPAVTPALCFTPQSPVPLPEASYSSSPPAGGDGALGSTSSSPQSQGRPPAFKPSAPKLSGRSPGPMPPGRLRYCSAACGWHRSGDKVPPGGHLAGPVGIFQAGRRMQSSPRSISRGFTGSGAGAGAWAGSAAAAAETPPASGLPPAASCVLLSHGRRAPRWPRAPCTHASCSLLCIRAGAGCPVGLAWDWVLLGAPRASATLGTGSKNGAGKIDAAT